MHKPQRPARIDFSFQGRTDRCLALTRLAIASSRARIEESMRLLRPQLPVKTEPQRDE
ncbi:hypothetical protein U8607_00910 [Methylobacterium durans]|uniref:hypothetical protein n=1 Tax=Methylobacterium durans TaxID=2202825 RepID=UPI002AFF4975|nr:hypothetical protein [Methylobacterium durans]MEA1830629.1 hypothetical protein [Methylobacterium durans]